MWSWDRYGRWIEQHTEWVVTGDSSAPEDKRPTAATEEAMDVAELTELVDRLEKRGQ
jgi:hypothetical protein